MTSVAIRQFSATPAAVLISTLVDLLRLTLTSGQAAQREDYLRKIARSLFCATELQGTPIGDALEDDLGRPGTQARNARRLVRFVESMIEAELERGYDRKNLAHWLAITLGDANGAPGIIAQSPRSPPVGGAAWETWSAGDQSRIEKLRRALLNKLWGLETDMPAACEPVVRHRLAVELVDIAARASGFKQPKKKLHDAERVKAAREGRKRRT
jgi:hypothetical protein